MYNNINFTDGQTINHVWDGSKQIIADVIDNQFYEADCYIRGTNLVAKYNYKNGDKSEYTYYTQNAHGDVVNLTNAEGAVTKSYKYDAFGVEKNIDKNDANAFRYCGEYYDTETGTIYLRARYYNPSTGRFISRDSFAGRKSDPLSLNLYTYCHNNPIIGVDPSGHFFKELKEYISSAVGSAGKKILSSFNSKITANAGSQVVTNTAHRKDITPITGGLAVPTTNVTTYTVTVNNKVKYDVPLYDQGDKKICWAYSVAMIRSYFKRDELTTKIANYIPWIADGIAKDIAVQHHGPDDLDKGERIEKIGTVIKRDEIDGINGLYDILAHNGPVGATYYDAKSRKAHMVVITGVDRKNDIIYSNNPQGYIGEQSYEEFLSGYVSAKEDKKIDFYAICIPY